jgi:hypothetical protein
VSTVVTVKERLTTQDEGVGHEGRCHVCGSVYKSALFLDRAAPSVQLVVECPCGQQVQMERVGVVRHKPALPIIDVCR